MILAILWANVTFRMILAGIVLYLRKVSICASGSCLMVSPHLADSLGFGVTYSARIGLASSYLPLVITLFIYADEMLNAPWYDNQSNLYFKLYFFLTIIVVGPTSADEAGE